MNYLGRTSTMRPSGKSLSMLKQLMAADNHADATFSNEAVDHDPTLDATFCHFNLQKIQSQDPPTGHCSERTNPSDFTFQVDPAELFPELDCIPNPAILTRKRTRLNSTTFLDQEISKDDVTKSLALLFSSTNPSENNIRCGVLKALVALSDAGVAKNHLLLSSEFLESISDSLTRVLVDTSSCKAAVELLHHLLVTKVKDATLIKKAREIVGFNLGVVASVSNDEDVCSNIASIKEKFDGLVRRGKK